MKALLQLAGLPRSTFYYYVRQSHKPAKYQMVKAEIITIFNKNKKRYGYRRITQELHNNDICVNHKTVQKLMKQLGLVCHVRERRKYNSYKGEIGEVAPNLLERHFKTNQPNRKWVTDVTEFKVNDQKLYLSPIIDLFNGEVVSYNLSLHPNFKQITDMLEGAFQKLPNKVDNLILHSDQGWQYQMKSYQNLLKAKGITQSMSRKATCLDNAVAENFFGLLKTELFYLEKFDSIDQLEKAIIDYIDYYNNRRIKLKLNGLSPVQYRIQTVGGRLIRFLSNFWGSYHLIGISCRDVLISTRRCLNNEGQMPRNVKVNSTGLVTSGIYSGWTLAPQLSSPPTPICSPIARMTV